ncbi:RNase adapter RapZ [Undibacterium sp. LX40W]|uniref:RNase adapter RapZ n=1 Tax=Undibacterium nitidum TaxID=2762298 RepID=A0A923HL20_9BURK|nr:MULTISPECIES: RNase adapter RapZ [Undibacterium]MBC3881007.1 RNase adapter RapZ [Undibacterium nitidum]MBC3890260.1 RNase adapter RapZ [Undibacterium sp. LX40W]
MRILLISGISGSGKSVALNVIEDAGFYCVDNLPPSLLVDLVNTLEWEGVKSAAMAIDSRSAHLLKIVPEAIERLRQLGHEVKVLFLTASSETLIARFSETRRSHPLSHLLQQQQLSSAPLSLVECIQKERELLEPLQFLGHVIDTSFLSANSLRQWIKDEIGVEQAPLILMFESFAFKVGVPLDVDFVFDVRILPNPHYDHALRPLTGKDQPVINFLDQQEMAQDLYRDIQSLIEKWLPEFKRDNRSYLTVGIGCTGGQHRSVYMVEKLAKYFQQNERVLIRHRQTNCG